MLKILPNIVKSQAETIFAEQKTDLGTAFITTEQFINFMRLYDRYLYHVFVDFQKAFDRVWKETLLSTTNDRLIRFIENLWNEATSGYWGVDNIWYLYMLSFKFILGLNYIFFCFKVIITHYHTQKQKKIKFKPRIKLNHNIYILFITGLRKVWVPLPLRKFAGAGVFHIVH